MKFLIVNCYYADIVNWLYAHHPGLEHQPYVDQHGACMQDLLGSADFFSHNLNTLGHEAWDVVANIEPMQMQWARERGVAVSRRVWAFRLRRRCVPWLYRRTTTDWMERILEAQVRTYRPDVVYCFSLRLLSKPVARAIRKYCRLVVGQHASPLPDTDLSGFDLILSSLPNQVQHFRSLGLRSDYLRLGFEPRALDLLRPGPKRYDVGFVGGLGGPHDEGTRILEALAARVPTDAWGYGVEKLLPTSPLGNRFHGPLWGSDYYQALRDARLVFNRHIGVAEQYANNLRLFEGTGVGSCLLTDWKPNLGEFFEPGKEVVAYRSADEAVEQARYYLEHAEEREAIAAAGQRRTLAEHTWRHRMQDMVEIVKRYV